MTITQGMFGFVSSRGTLGLCCLWDQEGEEERKDNMNHSIGEQWSCDEIVWEEFPLNVQEHVI